MRKDFNIFVEGLADECFFKQYLRHMFGEVKRENRFRTYNKKTYGKTSNLYTIL